MKFNFKKKFGQNFLKDDKVIANIANSIKPTEKDLIIEIGPGSGALTSYLKNFESYMICYEIDPELDQFLSLFENDKVKIIYDDFLKRDIKRDISKIQYENLYIIGNLPYYITTPIINRILNLKLNAKEMIFMVQKEVADRFSSKPGSKTYGSLTVYLNYFYNIENLFVVKRDKFIPEPNVDSAVVSFSNKELIPVNFEMFENFVRDSFKMKRKNLKNNLKKYNLDKVNEILKEYGFNITNRAEDIPYQVYIELANKYK